MPCYTSQEESDCYKTTCTGDKEPLRNIEEFAELLAKCQYFLVSVITHRLKAWKQKDMEDFEKYVALEKFLMHRQEELLYGLARQHPNSTLVPPSSPKQLQAEISAIFDIK